MHRRILAITLLIAFGFPLVAPVFAAATDPEASLPPCCRTHGAHHCAMMHGIMLAQSRTPTFVPPTCPYYPAAIFPAQLALSFAAPNALSVTPPQAPPPPASATRRAALAIIATANLKRGPPALLA